MITATYLLLNLFTLAGPLARSFESRVAFYRRFGALLPAIFVTGAAFIAWDVVFTELGVWSFNDDYLLGIRLMGLPIEEWLFFLTVPYACVFVYDCLNYFLPTSALDAAGPTIAAALGAALLLGAIAHHDRMYTAITFACTGPLLIGLAIGRAPFLGKFFRAYAVCLIPFFLVNGALTGFFTSAPIVAYDDHENLGVRLGTIPLEDTVYMMLLLLMNTALYEHLQRLRVLGTDRRAESHPS